MYLRGNIYYTDFYTRTGKRERISLKTSDEQSARKLEKLLFKFFKQQNPSSEETVLWNDFKKWYLCFLSGNRSASTRYIHKLAIQHFEQYHRTRFLREITPDLLLGFKSYLQRRAAQKQNKPGPAGRNRLVKALKSMMKTAEKLKKIGVNQEWSIVAPECAEAGCRVVWHSLAELRQIRAVLAGDLLTVFYLGWEEGLRRGEIAHLYKTDYNPSAHTITVSKKPNWAPKTKRSARTIPLRPDSERAIRESIAHNPDSPYIVNLEGDREKPTYLSYQYRQAVKTFAPHLHTFLHKLRHTYGTMLIQANQNIKTVCDLMGHSNTLQTEKYVHLGQSEYAEAVSHIPSLGA